MKGIKRVVIAKVDDVQLFIRTIREIEQAVMKNTKNSAQQRHVIHMLQITSNCSDAIVRSASSLTGVHNESELRRHGSLYFVSLAGMNCTKPYYQKLDGQKGKFAVDRSLSALGDVFTALNNKQSHIPYRNSKLTHLLEPCLGGKGKTAFIFHICPSLDSIQASIHTLAFARRIRPSAMTVADHDCKCEITLTDKTDARDAEKERRENSKASDNLPVEHQKQKTGMKTRKSSRRGRKRRRGNCPPTLNPRTKFARTILRTIPSFS